MKIQCNACGAAEARVLCCADEAALCAACDEEVHAANKLAGKHQRVPLLRDDAAPAAAPAVPKCDICQEASGYFFCLEDRALLCRDCDVAIHTVNSFVSAHQRFLLTGVQVGLDPADPVPPVADKHVNAAGGSVLAKHLPRRNPTVPFSAEASDSVPSQNITNGDYSRQNSVPAVRTGAVNWTMNSNAIRSVVPRAEYVSDEGQTLLPSSQTTAAFSNQSNGENDRAYKLPFSISGGNGSECLPDWPVDEFFNNSEFGPNFGFVEHCSSKCDIAKLGSAGGSPQCRLAEGFVAEELLGQVPGFDADESWTVPEVPSPPTASGLYWQGNVRYPAYDSTMFVPEVSSFQSAQNIFAVPGGFKRRRRQF